MLPIGFILTDTVEWLGEQADSNVAANLISNFDATTRYLYFSTTNQTVREIRNNSYTAPVNPGNQYTAEPISTPSGVSGISGVTAGAGLDGGGTSGVVNLAIDETATDFPIIPIDKGGTGADTASDARVNLGLGTASTRDVGNDPGDVPLLGGTVGIMDPQDLAANTVSAADGDVLTYNGTLQAWQTPTVETDATLSG